MFKYPNKKNSPRSTIFISTVEINCQANEGILKASEKTGQKYDKLINETVKGYIKCFLNKNIEKQYKYFFFNVPAPIYDPVLSNKINKNVAEVVALFNTCLLRKRSRSNISIIDIYTNTHNEKSFSNGLYHCDKRHLDDRITPLIQGQLNM